MFRCKMDSNRKYRKKYLALEEINKISREVLIKTKDIVQKQGFELVYADTDSVFVKKRDASRLEYKTSKTF